MFLRLFIPLDGSPLAERVLPLATTLAQRTAASKPTLEPLLMLFRAVDPSPWLDLPGGGARAQALETATHYLEVQAEALRKAGLTVETAVRLGHPAEEILEQVMGRQAELVVMSTRGRSGMTRWALGSVAERVVRTAPVPALLLPEAAPTTLGQFEPPGAAPPLRLLVPLDGSVTAEAALGPGMELAQLLEAELWLLYVFVPHYEEVGISESQRAWEAGRRRVQQVEGYLLSKMEVAQQAGVRARWTLGSGMPAAKIIEEAHTHQVSLIVMTTQGRGGLVRWRLGSVAEEVIHSGRLPVMVVPSSTPGA
jgi:nucleotide-binding universal stress UspA family protein